MCRAQYLHGSGLICLVRSGRPARIERPRRPRSRLATAIFPRPLDPAVGRANMEAGRISGSNGRGRMAMSFPIGIMQKHACPRERGVVYPRTRDGGGKLPDPGRAGRRSVAGLGAQDFAGRGKRPARAGPRRGRAAGDRGAVRQGPISARAARRLTVALTLQRRHGGEEIACLHTPDGPVVLAVGRRQVGLLLKGIPAERRRSVSVEYPAPW